MYCFLISLKGTNELCICMEFMDASVAAFYRAMHSLGEVVFDKLDQLVRRIIHDVRLMSLIDSHSYVSF
jgi:hypothetical protein